MRNFKIKQLNNKQIPIRCSLGFGKLGHCLIIFGICLGFWILVFGFCSIARAASATLDPMTLGVGARSLSMGRTNVVAPGNINAIFVNPANAAYIESWSATSMYTSLLEGDITYTLLGGGGKSPWGGLGVAYLGGGSNGIEVTSRDAYSRIVPTGSTFDYSNSTIALAWGKILRENLAAGASLKLFNKGFSGYSSGSGYDLDLGLLYKWRENISLGLSAQNILPEGTGDIDWETGTKEDVEMLIKAGMKYSINKDLLVNADMDFSPFALHSGIEWKLHPIFTLRGGIDQVPTGSDTAMNFGLGLGIKYSGVSFDYAYYKDTVLDVNSTHYLSLGFVAEPKEEIKKVEIPEEVKPKIKLKTFIDVPEAYWARKEIEYLATVDVISGYPDNTFKPNRTLSRAEMVTLLAKATGAKKEFEKSSFSDVSGTHWAKNYIEYAVEKGWVQGYPDNTFKPGKDVSRAEAITILVKFDQLKTKKKVTLSVFEDVSSVHWAFDSIDLAKEAGWLDYIKVKDFYPNKGFSRAEAAYVLSKTSFGKAKIAELLKKL